MILISPVTVRRRQAEEARRVRQAEEYVNSIRYQLEQIPKWSIKERCNIVKTYNKIIYCHVPKTAGISFTCLKLCRDIGHNTFYRKTYPDYIAIAVVRNPYMRFISAYRYLLNGGRGHSIDLSYQKIIRRYSSVYHFLNDIENHKATIEHFKPQIKLMSEVDIVFRYESLHELAYLFPSITELPRNNITSSNINIELTDKLKETIYNAYSDDFQLLNYSR